VKICYCTEIY